MGLRRSIVKNDEQSKELKKKIGSSLEDNEIWRDKQQRKGKINEQRRRSSCTARATSHDNHTYATKRSFSIVSTWGKTLAGWKLI
mmetsp:Transcript_7806/g.16537  ORF Transcript_7806/g.16537 Transcript_7806/m.16537 type:complete len:85 (+) Transcript_7806:390-644(+)